MTAPDILKQLQSLGDPSYKKILMRHGAQEPVYGVKIAELKQIQKQVKKNYELARELYNSGNYDAQYLAGLINDDARMTKSDLKQWLAKCNCSAIARSIVAPVAAASKHGAEIAIEWIESKDETAVQTGWTALASRISITDDSELDLAELKKLLSRIVRTIHKQPNMVRYAMNNFVITLGSYVAPLTDDALQAADAIGPVEVDMGETACQVPSAREYIEKVKKRGSIGKKRKTAIC